MENIPPIYYTPPFTTPPIYYPLVYPQFYYTSKITTPIYFPELLRLLVFGMGRTACSGWRKLTKAIHNNGETKRKQNLFLKILI